MSLNIRAVRPEDIPVLQRLHDSFYPDLEFPDFHFLLSAFVIEDENQRIVMAGGIEGVGEALLVTNKNVNSVLAGKALMEAHRFSLFSCARLGLRNLIAITHEETYTKHLIQHGFAKREGTLLSMKVQNG